MGIMRTNQIFFQNCLAAGAACALSENSPSASEGAACPSVLVLSSQLSAVGGHTFLTHRTLPPAWLELTDVPPARSPAQHHAQLGQAGPRQAQPSLPVAPALCPLREPAAEPRARTAAGTKPQPHLCQARHRLQQTAAIAKGKMENLQKTNITNTCTN